jgi:hypothetical protein
MIKLDEKRLAEIEKRIKKVGEDPWFMVQVPSDEYVSFRMQTFEIRGIDYPIFEIGKPYGIWRHNASFIVHAKVDVPWLLAQVKMLRAELERLKADTNT